MALDNLRRLRVTKIRVAAQSIVGKGAAKNSDAFLLQSAPAFVDDTIEQGVAEELNEVRARSGGWDIWCAFQEALSEAQTPADVESAIDELPGLLKAELCAPGDNDGDEPIGMTDEGDSMTQEETQPQTPTEEPVVQAAPEIEDETTPETPAAITQADVEALIQAALSPITEELTAAKQTVEQQATEIEALKNENAALTSKTQPRSQQPEGEAGTPITQAAPTSPWAGTAFDGYVKGFRR